GGHGSGGAAGGHGSGGAGAAGRRGARAAAGAAGGHGAGGAAAGRPGGARIATTFGGAAGRCASVPASGDRGHQRHPKSRLVDGASHEKASFEGSDRPYPPTRGVSMAAPRAGPRETPSAHDA